MSAVVSTARPPRPRRGMLMRREVLEGILLAVGAAIVIFVIPNSVGRDAQNTLFTLFMVAALAQAWNIIGGFGGQFSLGNAAFVGIGSYATAILLIHTGLGSGLVILASGLISAAVATVAGFGLLRLRGVYFAIGSLAVVLAIYSWMINWSFTGLTQGLTLPLGKFPDEEALFQLMAIAVVLATAVAWTLRWSRFGLRLQAVRDDEDAASVAGVNASAVKMIAFVLSAFITGLVGSLYAMHQIFIEPTAAFSLSWTIDMIVMAIVGGIGTVVGPLLGATVVYYGIEKELGSNADLSAILTGVLLVIAVRFAPGGIWGLLLDGGRAVAERVPAFRRQAR